MSTEAGFERMVMTILEARVVAEQWDALRRIHTESSSHLPPQMVQVFLVQNTADPTSWQVIAIWRSRKALEEYRRSTETPGGVLMFRSVGAEPTLAVFEVLVDAHQAS